jgi:hypothetical protein
MTPEPVKLYVGPWYRSPISHIPLLYPFWGVAKKSSKAYVYDLMEKYQFSKEDFTLVDHIVEADYVLVPHNYRRLRMADPHKFDAIARDARAAGKPLLVDASGDIEWPVTTPNTVSLRLSQYRYAVRPGEITVPFLADDLLAVYYGGQAQLRKKGERPSVGFAGWAQFSPRQRLKTYVKELPITLASFVDPRRRAEHKGIYFREQALQALRGNARVDSHILSRATYSGHAATLQGTFEDSRREFVENLHDSDYALAVRGDANSSVRFYEALSLGRIPLFLDTACVLPLEGHIDYREFCVFVDHADVARIGDILADFHTQVSPERFIEMQRKARVAYEQFLRLDVFSRHLAEELRSRLHASS